MPLRLYNTLTRSKEIFTPMAAGMAKMFVCGLTVYDFSHIGHAKTYTQFDFLARYLRKLGYQLQYVQNVTDIDDKIIHRANLRGVQPGQLASEYERFYLEDMAALRNTSVDVYARAHDYIDQIVRQIQVLIAGGHAYQLDDGWYFDLTTFPEYGKLSRRRQAESGDSVSRVDQNESKRNQGDFALWKARRPGEPYWSTPIGAGRPGWHIEDTAIAHHIFGPQYDLHGGAMDLIFPHHEAEIAQMEAAYGQVPLARYWVHTGLLRVGGAKMAKSAENFITIRDSLKLTDFRTLRYAFLSQHYRSPMEVGPSTFESARRARRRVENFARLVDLDDHEVESSRALVASSRERFFERLDDDLDTPGALAVLFEFIRDQNRSGEPPGRSAWNWLHELEELFEVFELEDHRAGEASVEQAVRRRQELRAAGQYEQADAIRRSLQDRGVVLEDTPRGTRWRYGDRPAR